MESFCYLFYVTRNDLVAMTFQMLHKRDSSSAWLVICGKQYSIGIEMGLENPAVAYFGEMNQTRVTIVKMARNMVY